VYRIPKLLGDNRTNSQSVACMKCSYERLSDEVEQE
jgi:hypothetical protein